MKAFTNQAFTLHSDALEANTLIVNKLKGHEQLSGLFRFELELLSADRHLVLEEVVASAVTLTIKQLTKVDLGMVAQNREFTGVLTEFEQHEEGQGWVSYRATLVPEVWQLTQFHRSRIFQQKSAPQIVKEILEERGLLASVDGANGGSGDFGDFDFEPKIDKKMESPTEDQAEYPLRAYVVQYEENDWDFVTRWLEHEGIYFYFENEEKRERIVFGDASTDCVAVSSDSLEASFPYRPATGSGSSEGAEERIITFLCKQTRAPQTVALNDYNWRDAMRLSTVQQVAENGVGLQTEYNDHYKNEDQGKALAKARMEELLCLTKLFHGTSTARAFRPGKTFKLKEHYRSDFNIDYLLVSVVHEAEQTINLAASTVTGATYHNSFTAIPADVPFRPDRVTDWPTIKGVMNAKVDAIEGTKYADLDKDGCYTVRIPFDPKYEEDNPGGASRRVRMAQPFTGMDAGFHFPLLGGTEVILTHIDGDPDRPIIAGAVPDAATGNVGAGDESRNRIVSNAGNRFEIHDKVGASGFFMADATGAVISDQRNRLGNKKGGTAQGGKAAAKSPGSGGAARRQQRTGKGQRRTSGPSPRPGRRPLSCSGDRRQRRAARSCLALAWAWSWAR